MENNRQEFKKRLKGLLGFILSLSIVVSMSGMNAYALSYDLDGKDVGDTFDTMYASDGETIYVTGGTIEVSSSSYFTKSEEYRGGGGTVGTFHNIPSDKVVKVTSETISKPEGSDYKILPVTVTTTLVDAPYIIAYHNYDGSVVKKGSAVQSVSIFSAEYLGFTNEGKKFGGWAASPNGDVITDGSHTFETEGTYDLYARWGDYTYSITFNCVGGAVIVGSESATIRMLDKNDSRVNKPGYTFKHWSYTEGGGEAFKDGDAFTFSSSGYLNLYAVYEKKDTTIDTPGTYHLVPGKQYLMIGSYKVNGSSVSYAGGAFYVPVEGDYTFQ